MRRLFSAELYDIATGTWATTGGMFYDRWGSQIAAPLNDGGAVVAAGVVGFQHPGTGELLNANSALSAELFHHTLGVFSSTGRIVHGPRWGHTLTALRDGTVLMSGGATNYVEYLKHSERTTRQR